MLIEEYMIKRFLLFSNLFFFVYNVNAQISVNGIPESFSINTKEAVIIPVKVLNTIDTSKLLAEDKLNGITYRYGVVQQVNIDIKAEGFRTEITGKGTIWQYEIKSIQTYSLGITFGKYHLPEGASVFIYDEAHSHRYGAFTNLNNKSFNQLTIADFSGKNAIIEYFEPNHLAFSGQLVISSVSQGYKNIQLESTALVGINCPVGADWQVQKHAVCCISFHDSEYNYLCSGFLVNNVLKDGTPYFQTANHCISTNYEAGTMVAYFNYEDSTCTSNDAILSKSQHLSRSGASLEATNSYSDFTLLLLGEYPPSQFIPYYAGWDASSRNPKRGTDIHHPEGLPKCIALDYNAPVSYPEEIDWSESNSNTITSISAPNTHWDAIFSIGGTEPGSSGSPLLDDNHHAIGQLHGGDNIDNYFGKFSLSWDHDTIKTKQLKYWLDPDTTGILVLDGFFYNIIPLASFSTNFTNVCPGSVITLNDESLYSPSSWLWSIQPSSFEFVNGTTNTSENPEIIFDSIGYYTVSLTVVNNNGTDSIVKKNYIHSGNILVRFSGITADSVICGCNLINYPLVVTGATNYTFSLGRTDKINYTIVSDSMNALDSIYLSLNPSQIADGSFNAWIKVKGTQGTCSGSDSILMRLVVPVNDDIQYAIPLLIGANGPFSNFCASVQPYEVAAPNVTLSNTIWFTFTGTSNGIITIDTHGFNDKIAIWEANSDTDLISQSGSTYNLLAVDVASDSNTLTSNLAVVPYKTYWLQLDGVNGATGNCVIDLLDNNLDVYPNPTTGDFYINISSIDDGIADVKIYTLLGQVIYSNDFSITKGSNIISFNLSRYPAGIYLIVANINGVKINSKISLVN